MALYLDTSGTYGHWSVEVSTALVGLSTVSLFHSIHTIATKPSRCTFEALRLHDKCAWYKYLILFIVNAQFIVIVLAVAYLADQRSFSGSVRPSLVYRFWLVEPWLPIWKRAGCSQKNSSVRYSQGHRFAGL